MDYGKLELTDSTFARLQDLVRRATAIELPASKKQLAYSRFARRVHALGLDTFEQYCDLIDRGDPDEMPQFASAITTNFSNFFRERHHFEFLARFLREREDRRVRIWSAGCATGEEPYSIAMTVLDTLGERNDWDVRILATDIDTAALSQARSGVYPRERIVNVDSRELRRWFQRGTGSQERLVRVAPRLRRLIRFRELNLIEPWPMNGPFDLIFCRNVVIYFGLDVKRTLFERFAAMQRPGAPLIIGHSENLSNITARYAPQGNTIYLRNPDG